MNVIDFVVDGFKRFYTSENSGSKHVILFIISAIMSVFSTYIQLYPQTVGKTLNIESLGMVVIFSTIVFLLSLYMCGFIIKFNHNAFDDENRSILPDFNFEPIKIFCKMLPVIFAWFFYLVIAIILLFLFCSVDKTCLVIGIILGTLLFILYSFTGFITIAFAKNYKRDGLYNILLPLVYMNYAFGDVMLLAVLFMLMSGAALSMCFMVGLAGGLNGLGATPPKETLYVVGVLYGYFSLVLQMIWSYSLVQIYKHKIEPKLNNY